MASAAAVTSPSTLASATAAYPTGPTKVDVDDVGKIGSGKGGGEVGTKEKRKVAGWRHFVAGGVGGMTGAIVTSPFDVVKTRLQSDLFRESSHPSLSSSSTLPTSSSSAGGVAQGIKPVLVDGKVQGVSQAARMGGARGLLWNFVETGQMIRNIYVYEGPAALFKGLGPTLIGVVPARSINFSTYAASKSFLGKHLPDSIGDPSRFGSATGVSAGEGNPVVHLGAAAIAGICTATATNPIWVVKTRLQLEARHRKRSTPAATSPPTNLAPAGAKSFHSTATSLAASGSLAAQAKAASAGSTKDKMLPAFRMTLDILKQEGVVGLYRGLSASYLGVTEGVIQWVLYERLKKVSTQTYPGQPAKGKLAEWVGIVGSSGGAKMVASLITYPHEVIRTRLRQPAEANGRVKYTGLWQTLKLVIAEEGAASLYGGLSAHLMRVVPNAACMFTIYEIALRL